MLWVTRKTIRINRSATAWLIRRFVDPPATFRFVTANEVEDVQHREGARGFDAPGASYPHRDERGRCSFEALVDEHCPRDLARARAASWSEIGSWVGASAGNGLVDAAIAATAIAACGIVLGRGLARGQAVARAIFTLEANGPPAIVAALAALHVAITAAVLALGLALLRGRRRPT